MATRRRLKAALQERADQLGIPREILDVEHRPKAVGALPPKPITVPPPLPVPAPPEPEIVIVGQTQKLTEGVTLSMERMLGILRHDILKPEKDITATDLAFLKLQKDVGAIFLRTQTRVDDARLREKTVDRLGAILERLRALSPGTPPGTG